MMHRYLFIFLSLFLTQSVWSQNYERSIITDPSVSRRCRELLEEREQKIVQKQRLSALILRNKRLQKVTPSERQSIIKNLKKNLRHLNQEMKLTKTKIQHQEENIIRRGCPGITL